MKRTVFGVPVNIVASQSRCYGARLVSIPPKLLRTKVSSPTEKNDTDVTNAEFQFFYKRKYPQLEKTFPTCRACGKILSTGASRKIHLQLEGCSKIVIGAMRVLRHSQACVVCEKYTTKTRWGFPLCSHNQSSTCVENWKKGENVSLDTKKLLRGHYKII